MKYYLSFDIGGTEIKFAVLTQDGEFIENNKIKTQKNGDEIIRDIVSVKQQLSQKYLFQGAAFSMPGFVNVETGTLQSGGAIKDFYGINFKGIMTEKLGLPVELDNDVNCVALAEKWLGNGKNIDDFICITIGTGVGGAICLNGQIVRGHHYHAGEFGFMLTKNIFTETDGKINTLSHSGSIRDGLIGKYCSYHPNDKGKLSGLDIYHLAEQGDLIAIKVIDEFYQSIAIGLFNLIFILNPEKILIGGAISLREEIFSEIKTKLQEIILAHGEVKQLSVDDLVKIENTHFYNDSGMIGALYHFLQMNKPH